MPTRLEVLREFQGTCQLVGCLEQTEGSVVFSYDEGYLAESDAAPISAALPLRSAPFPPTVARAFFDGLLPEGSLRRSLAAAAHSDPAAFDALLARLNNESAGALIFRSDDGSAETARSYLPYPSESLAEFARQPQQAAFAMSMSSRLSLAGAQAKIGLYRQGRSDGESWFAPAGSAPSTHIVKAASGAFPHQTINEALCMKTAKNCGFDVANCRLLPIEKADPLLVVERFDRTIPRDAMLVDGLPVPHRLHQEDFCQIAKINPIFKYEPTDGHYLALGAAIISREARNPFGDKMMFFARVIFDWLIGNCDNHLKNHSLTWMPDWSAKELSPLYDITCTTMYPQLDRSMGVSLCSSRSIDDVTRGTIHEEARRAGIPGKAADEQLESLVEEFPRALEKARGELVEEGFAAADEIARFIREDAAARIRSL